MLNLKDVTVKNRIAEVNLVLKPARVVHILGNNGVGKSTLLSVMSALLVPDSGTVQLSGKDLSEYELAELAKTRCLQEQGQHQAFSVTVRETLEFFSSTKMLPDCLEKALEISAFMQRDLITLSGGEQGRVHIARVLLQVWPAIENGDALILLDEPIQGLDYRHQHLLFGLLNQLSRKGNLVVVTHHDLNLCYQYADELVLLKDRRVYAVGPAREVMNEEFLEQAFCCKISCYSDDAGNRLFQTYLN